MNRLGKKDFNGWIKIKKKLHWEGLLRSFNEGEIWWCRIGENVGSEICGKGKDFLRPVLIIHKLSKYNFIGVPLTSSRHTGSWYIEFIFKGKEEYAVIAQIENISVKRLHYKMGEVPEPDLDMIIDGINILLNSHKNKSSPYGQDGRVTPKVYH